MALKFLAFENPWPWSLWTSYENPLPMKIQGHEIHVVWKCMAKKFMAELWKFLTYQNSWPMEIHILCRATRLIMLDFLFIHSTTCSFCGLFHFVTSLTSNVFFSGAIAGNPFGIDRQFLAKGRPTSNVNPITFYPFSFFYKWDMKQTEKMKMNFLHLDSWQPCYQGLSRSWGRED